MSVLCSRAPDWGTERQTGTEKSGFTTPGCYFPHLEEASATSLVKHEQHRLHGHERKKRPAGVELGQQRRQRFKRACYTGVSDTAAVIGSTLVVALPLALAWTTQRLMAGKRGSSRCLRTYGRTESLPVAGCGENRGSAAQRKNHLSPTERSHARRARSR